MSNAGCFPPPPERLMTVGHDRQQPDDRRRRRARPLGRPRSAAFLAALRAAGAARPADRLVAAAVAVLVVVGACRRRGRLALSQRLAPGAVPGRRDRHARGRLHLQRHRRPRPRRPGRAHALAPDPERPGDRAPGGGLPGRCRRWSALSCCSSSTGSRSLLGVAVARDRRRLSVHEAHHRLAATRLWASRFPGAR